MLSHRVLFLVLAVITKFSLITGQDPTATTIKPTPVVVTKPSPSIPGSSGAPGPAPPPSPEGSEECKVYPADEEKLKGFIEEVCQHVPAFGGSEENATWSDTWTPDDIYELAFVNMGYGLTSDAISHLPVDLGWRKVLLDQISYIARTTCDTDAIESMFLAGVKNLFQYYMVKLEKSLEKDTNTTRMERWKAEKYNDTWTEIINSLSKCAADLDEIKFEDECGVLNGYVDSKGMTQGTVEIEEQFDTDLEDIDTNGLDYIVDGTWWMFAASYARCYAFFYPNEDIILLYLQRFREDILSFFLERWKGTGELQDMQEVIFGPFDAKTQLENLRKCATSSFDYEGLKGRHLVRPVIVTVDNNKVRNYKIDKLEGAGSGGPSEESGSDYSY